MAIMNVNATRMALLTLKKKIKSAERGHKLLKDKQDGLMQKFMDVIREAKAAREEVEEKLLSILESNDTLLLKGSRAMRLENILKMLKDS